MVLHPGQNLEKSPRRCHLSYLFAPIAAVCVIMMMSASVAMADGKPSPEAQGMPGAKGTFDFKPADWNAGATTWWEDTDGVDPGTAGCHIGTDSDGNPNGRMFGEACLPDGLLVETNPRAGLVHKHTNDVGHPDKFDCNAWCIGQKSSKGVCTSAPAPPCAQSAMCTCN
jgi:hypothetical protein